MRILLNTHLFAPSIGGIETMSLLLARAFLARGHEVHIVTSTPSLDPDDDHGLTVIRCPDRKTLRREVAWCGICFHNNISLSHAWPLLLRSKPWVVTTQTWIVRPDGKLGWREHLKHLLLRRAHSVAISQAVALSLPVASIIIPNCYDQTTFFENATVPSAPREDLIFVGRLVSDKGADLALAALSLLQATGMKPRLTIVGDGPERSRLEAQSVALGLAAQIRFTGSLQGAALADELRTHRIQLVPSRWREPFGIVALEGAACGCIVIGSDQGGLPDAIGPCGFTFPNGNATALAECIAKVLHDEYPPKNTTARKFHLERHQPRVVIDSYLSLFDGLH